MDHARNIIKIACVLYLICVGLFSHQGIATAVPLLSLQQQHFKFQRFSSEQGLSQTTINAFMQDSKGYMWIGTQDGLNRFDGYEFSVFKRDDSRFSLSDNWINDLLEVDEKTLWVATELGGLNVYDKSEEAFYRINSIRTDETTPSSNKIIRLYQDDNQRLWLATSRGLNLYDKENKQFIRLESKLKPLRTRIYDIAMDSAHHLWLATANGLLVLSSDLNVVEAIELLPGAKIQPRLDRKAFQMGEGDILWIGTQQGLFRMDTVKRKAEKIGGLTLLGKNIADIQINDIAVNDKGDFWLALVDGICRLNFAQMTNECYQHELDNLWSIATNNTKSIYFDHSGQLWVGGSDSGFAISKPVNRGFVTLNQKSPNNLRLQGAGVRTVLRDKEGRLWIGHKNSGISVIDLKLKKTTYLNAGQGPRGLRSNQIRALYDAGDEIYVGYLNNWFSTINKKTGIVRHIDLIRDTNQNKFKPSTVYDFERLNEKDYLIATGSAGLFIWSPEKGQVANLRSNRESTNSLASNRVQDIFIDNGIWLATRSGLSKFDPITQTFVNYINKTTNSSNAANRIYSIDSDGAGHLWLGTRAGVFSFDPKTGEFTPWSRSGMAINDTVYAALQDNLGNLWLSTNDGLTRLDAKSRRYTLFRWEDGIQNNEFSAYSFFRDKEKNLYFGGISGLTIVVPDKVRLLAPVNRLFITDFKIFGEHQVTRKYDRSSPLDKAIEFQSSLTLSGKQSFFALSFSTLDHIAPEKVLYSYRLQGMFENWVTLPAGRRTATFSHLPTGDYVLEYRAFYPNSEWSGENARLEIHILPPIWLSWWAKVLYMILALAIGLFIYAVARQSEQVRRLESEKKIAELASKSKSRFLAVMSHEIRTPLNGIMGMLELLKKTPLDDSQNQYLHVAEKSGESLLSLVDDILDYSRIEAGKLERVESFFNINQLVDDVIKVFSGIVNTASLKLIASVDPGIEPWLYGDDKKLKQVLVNLLGNAVKFTDSGYVTLSIHLADSVLNNSKNWAISGRTRLVFVVSDSGIGISRSKQEYIFENFAQADERINRSYGGSGLGLAISKRLVEILGGNLELESEPGVGTTFKFSASLGVSWSGRYQNEVAASIPDANHGEFIPLFRVNEVRVLVIVDNGYLGDFIKISLERFRIAVHILNPHDLISQSPGFLESQGFSQVVFFCEDDASQNESNCLYLRRRLPDLPLFIIQWEHLNARSYQNGKNDYVVYMPLLINDLVSLFASPMGTKQFNPPSQLTRKDEGAGYGRNEKNIHCNFEKDTENTGLREPVLNQKKDCEQMILVAEDNEINQMVIKGVLVKLGYPHKIVANGRLTVDAYKEDPDRFSLILMDCEMPEMDGLEACKKIREYELSNGREAIPIIALSAHALEEHRKQALDCGMNDYVCKPVRMEKIQQVLTYWTEAQSAAG